jgi:hypothetical protein
VNASATAYLAATSTSSAARTDAFATIALGAGSVVNANEDGLPITATLAGGAASGSSSNCCKIRSRIILL